MGIGRGKGPDAGSVAEALPAYRCAQLARRQIGRHIRGDAFDSGTLQGGCSIVAAPAFGFDCGPMGGLDNAKIDAPFVPDGKWKANSPVNRGHGDPDRLYPRNPRSNRPAVAPPAAGGLPPQARALRRAVRSDAGNGRRPLLHKETPSEADVRARAGSQ